MITNEGQYSKVQLNSDPEIKRDQKPSLPASATGKGQVPLTLLPASAGFDVPFGKLVEFVI